jgi:hypothetical protein
VSSSAFYDHYPYEKSFGERFKEWASSLLARLESSRK